MSGLTGNNILAGSSGQGGYEIEQSLRFNDDDSPYLTRQYVSAGNRKIYTLSCWVKRGALGDKRIFGADGSSNFAWVLQFDSNNKISVGAYSGGYVYQVVTTAVYRDVGAWYHIVVATDTTQATASDRIKIYVNGEQVTAFDTASYPSLNLDTSINNNEAGRPHGIGYIPGSGGDYDGYLAELNVVDGQALTPSDFGETDLLTNQWIPKKYVGTYGTNGFYLNFSDSASLGADSSGNGNNWTPNNLAATDQVLDSPTNNFATLNPLLKTTTDPTMSEGNLKVVTASSGGCARLGTIVPSSGKWYAEFLVNSGSNCTFGVQDPTKNIQDLSSQLPIGSGSYAYYQANGYLYTNGTTQAQTGGATYTTGDIIGITLNLDDNEAKWYKNNTLVYTQALTSGQDLTFAGSDFSNSTSSTFSANFGQDSSFAGIKTAQNNTDANGIGDFYYAPPSGGYLALCENNLPDTSIALPGEHFNTVIWSGDNSSSRAITTGIAPDFVWYKDRTGVEQQSLYDSIRGAQTRLTSNSTATETSRINGLQSFDSTGFTVGSDQEGNASGRNYVGWNWKAGGTASSNTDGTITSTVSANTTAGFSIVSYTGNTATDTNYTVGHGLSQTPDLLIIKNRNWASSVSAWQTWHTSIGNNTLALDTTNATNSFDFTKFLNQQPNSTVFTVRADTGVTTGNRYRTNGQVNNYIAYCFHSVEGYSKFGTYTGNNSVDGPFVYTGFKPAMIIVKSTGSTPATYDWNILDSARNPYNYVGCRLRPNKTNADEINVYPVVDFLSNGFKFRHQDNVWNANGITYIYMAFAESPFKYSNAR